MHIQIAHQRASGEPDGAAGHAPKASQHSSHRIRGEREREQTNNKKAPTALYLKCECVEVQKTACCDGEEKRAVHFLKLRNAIQIGSKLDGGLTNVCA